MMCWHYGASSLSQDSYLAVSKWALGLNCQLNGHLNFLGINTCFESTGGKDVLQHNDPDPGENANGPDLTLVAALKENDLVIRDKIQITKSHPSVMQ